MRGPSAPLPAGPFTDATARVPPERGPSVRQMPQLEADQKRLGRWSTWAWSPWPG